jgi:hypothetical protein
MLALLRFLARWLVSREDPDEWRSRQPHGPLVDILETDRAHLESLTLPVDHRERE